jgi:multicomponent Na+:H+ antiporter subunit E
MRSLVTRAAVIAAAWMVLTGGDLVSLSVGLPAAACASWVSLILKPRRAPRVAFRGLVRFVPYFLWQSARGATAVAFLAARGPGSLDPVLCRIPARLEEQPARVMALCVCSLLPGSLGVELDGDEYVVHALSGPESAVVADMRNVERHVAAVFGARTREARA